MHATVRVYFFLIKEYIIVHVKVRPNIPKDV